MSTPSDINFQVTNKDIKRSYWYITHRESLRRLGIISLSILSGGFFVYTFWQAYSLFVVQGPAYRAMLATIDQSAIDYGFFRQAHRPTPIQLVGIDVLPATENRYDVIAQLRNTNTEWMTRPLTLELMSGGKVVAEQTAYIYPGQNRFVGFFGQKEINPAQITVQIKSTQWKRMLRAGRITEQYLNFVVNDVKFTPANSAGEDGGRLPSSNLHFTITNATAYSYWNVGVMMALLSTTNVGGASYFVVDQFKAGETRTIDVRWTQPIPPIFDTAIQPEVDFYSSASYMLPQ